MREKKNVNKIKVLWCNQIGRKDILVKLNGKLLEEVNCFRYLGMDVAVCDLGKGLKVFGDLKSIWKGRNISIAIKIGMYKSETWML